MKLLLRFVLSATVFASVISCDRPKPRTAGGTSGTPSGSANADAEADAAPMQDDKLSTPDGRQITKGKMVDTPKGIFAAAASPTFKAAVNAAAKLVGASPTPLEDPNEDSSSDRPVGVQFDVPHASVEKNLDAWHKQMLAHGAFLIRIDNSFAIGDAKDQLALLPTTDKYVALAVMQTNGANYDIMPGDIIDWLKGMEQTQPFDLTEAGMDYCAGNFTTPIKDPMKLARQMYEFCPDIVDQGTGDVDKLADELKKGKFFFWWD